MKAKDELLRRVQLYDKDSWQRRILERLFQAVNESATLTSEQSHSVALMVSMAVSVDVGEGEDVRRAFLCVPAIAAFINTCHE